MEQKEIVVNSSEYTSGCSLHISATIPYRPELPPLELIERLVTQFKTGMEQLAASFNQMPGELSADSPVMPLKIVRELATRSTTMLEDVNEGKGVPWRMFVMVLGSAASMIERLEFVPNDNTGNRDATQSDTLPIDAEEWKKSVSMNLIELGRISQELSEVTAVNKLDRLRLRCTIVGAAADVDEIGARMRQKAIELLREEQQEGADDNRWTTVLDGEQNVIRYRAPLGSKVDPILPAVDIDDPTQARSLLFNLDNTVSIESTPKLRVRVLNGTPPIDKEWD